MNGWVWVVPLILVAVVLVIWFNRRVVRRWLKELLASEVATKVVIPFVGALPPLVITASSIDEKHHLWPAQVWTDLRNWLDANPAIATAAFFWPIGVILGAYLLGKVRQRLIKLDELTAKEYGFVLHSIDNAAGEKMRRFGDAARRVVAEPALLLPNQIFATITQPLDQRSALIDGIYQIFRLDAESTEPASGDLISVKLARMKGGMFDSFEAWLPADHAPNSGPAQLCTPECSLSVAAATREPVIIEDIERELSRSGTHQFTAGALGSSATGSLISFPIIHQPTDGVPYVVTVRSEKAMHFRDNWKGRYRALLRPFLTRISSEHSLSLLKEYHERVNH
jgi:hypothetical protein